MWSILPVIFFACDPQPKSVSIEGAPEYTLYALEPLALPAARALSDKGEPIEHPVTWSVLTPDLARLSDDSKQLIPTAEGEIIVAATAGEISQKLHVKVAIPDQIEVTGISAGQQLTVGDTVMVESKVMDGTNPLPIPSAWTTSNDQVASIADGKVTAVAAGDAVLTVTAGELKFEVPVTVAAPVLTETVEGEGAPTPNPI